MSPRMTGNSLLYVSSVFKELLSWGLERRVLVNPLSSGRHWPSLLPPVVFLLSPLVVFSCGQDQRWRPLCQSLLSKVETHCPFASTLFYGDVLVLPRLLRYTNQSLGSLNYLTKWMLVCLGASCEDEVGVIWSESPALHLCHIFREYLWVIYFVAGPLPLCAVISRM